MKCKLRGPQRRGQDAMFLENVKDWLWQRYSLTTPANGTDLRLGALYARGDAPVYVPRVD